MNDYERLIQRIEARTRRRSGFALHATLFTMFAVCSIIFMLDPSTWRSFMTLPNTGDLFLILIVWGAVFASRAARFYFQDAGDREIERLYISTYRQGKRKPYREHLVLAEDGEMLDVIDDSLSEKRQRLED